MTAPKPRKQEQLHLLWRVLARATGAIGAGAKALLFLVGAAGAAVFFAAYADRVREARPMEVRARHFDHLVLPAESPPPLQCRSDACSAAAATLSPWVVGPDLSQSMVEMEFPQVQRYEAPPGGWIENLIGGGGTPAATAPIGAATASDAAGLALFEAVSADGSRRKVMTGEHGFVRATASPDVDDGRLRVWRPIDQYVWEPAYGARMAGWPRTDAPKTRRYTAIEFQPLPGSIAFNADAQALAGTQLRDSVVLFPDLSLVPARPAESVWTNRAWFGFVSRLEPVADGRVRVELVMKDATSREHNQATWFIDFLNTTSAAEPAPKRMLMWTWPKSQGPARDGWSFAARITRNIDDSLARLQGWRVSEAALDPKCVVGATPNPAHGCVWAVVRNTAVPLQVSIGATWDGQVVIRERAMAGGVAIAPEHWAALPALVRREFIATARADGQVAAPVLQPQSQVLRAPEPQQSRRAGDVVRVLAAAGAASQGSR